MQTGRKKGERGGEGNGRRKEGRNGKEEEKEKPGPQLLFEQLTSFKGARRATKGARCLRKGAQSSREGLYRSN